MSESAPQSALAQQSRHILVVEDNVALRFTLAEWLRLLGCIVHEAASADEALIVLASPLKIDCVVTDVQMPGTMDGFGLLRHIQEYFPALNVVVVSGTDSLKRLPEENIVFFRKPYDLKAIASHIAKQLHISPLPNEILP